EIPRANPPISFGAGKLGIDGRQQIIDPRAQTAPPRMSRRHSTIPGGEITARATHSFWGPASTGGPVGARCRPGALCHPEAQVQDWRRLRGATDGVAWGRTPRAIAQVTAR